MKLMIFGLLLALCMPTTQTTNTNPDPIKYVADCLMVTRDPSMSGKFTCTTQSWTADTCNWEGNNCTQGEEQPGEN